MELQSEMISYMMHRVAALNIHSLTFKNNSLRRPTHTEQSHVMYLEVLDAVADCKDNMILLFTTIHLCKAMHEVYIVCRNHCKCIFGYVFENMLIRCTSFIMYKSI